MPTRSVPALLAGDAPRSEHDPDLEAAAAATSIAMHPVTGAFADPTHELAFAAHLFRLSFRGHVLLMALSIATLIRFTLSTPPGVEALVRMCAFCVTATLGLIGRVLVQRMEDTVRAQRMGSWTWTAVMVVDVLLHAMGYALHPAATCEAVAMYYSTMYGGLIAVWTVLVNGSHGMGFAHKTGLVGALLLDGFLGVGMCGMARVPIVGLSATSIVVFAVAHLAEMHLRHSYAEKRRLEERSEEEKRQLEERNEQLQAEKERLLYDVQCRGCPLDDGDDRSAIRRGLQAGPSQPYHRADSTDSSETGAPAPSDSPPASLPPGPPSSSDHKSSKSGKSGKGTGNSSRAVHDKSTAPPPTWAELDARFYAERAAESAAKRGMPPGATSSTAGATSSSASQSPSTVPPPSWAELAYRRFYAERAARSTAEESRRRPPMAQPPTWAELDAQFYAERAARSANEQGAGVQGSSEASTTVQGAVQGVVQGSSEQELAAAQALTDIGQRRIPSARCRDVPFS